MDQHTKLAKTTPLQSVRSIVLSAMAVVWMLYIHKYIYIYIYIFRTSDDPIQRCQSTWTGKPFTLWLEQRRQNQPNTKERLFVTSQSKPLLSQTCTHIEEGPTTWGCEQRFLQKETLTIYKIILDYKNMYTCSDIELTILHENLRLHVSLFFFQPTVLHPS